MSEGAWIFLSHSHKDFDQVRALRNELEDLGHHPLMFFLKCLDDDSEVDDLIRREIQARSWFLLCDSANSRASRWVQEERRIIDALPDHFSVKVVLTDPSRKQIASLSALTKRASVFLSYTHEDHNTAGRIEAALRENDFGVFSDLQIPPGEDWQVRIRTELEHAATKGAILVLLSQASLRSVWQRREIQYAFEHMDTREHSTNIIPLFVDPPEAVFPLAPPQLMDIQGIDFSTGNFSQNMLQLMRALKDYDWDS